MVYSFKNNFNMKNKKAGTKNSALFGRRHLTFVNVLRKAFSIINFVRIFRDEARARR